MIAYIKAIQEKLAAAGFYKGAIDGIVGKQTAAAIDQLLAKVGGSPATSTATASWELSQRSKEELFGVDDDLRRVVEKLAQTSTLQFEVIEGLRTSERQAELVKQGASQTMNSKHLTGEAVDIVPLINGKISWDWEHIYRLTDALKKVATELKVKIRWGGCWQVITDSPKTAKQLSADYVASKRAIGGSPFLDGVHFEIRK